MGRNAKGAGGHGDTLQSGGQDKEVRDREEEGKTGAATEMEKAMNMSKA